MSIPELSSKIEDFTSSHDRLFARLLGVPENFGAVPDDLSTL